MNVKESVIDAIFYDVEVPTRRFTGTVDLQRIGDLNGIGVSLVHFYDGARTYWHAHPGGQILLILRGKAEVAAGATGIARELVPGDMVQFDANERHWHGAAPNTNMTHLSIAFGETKWEDKPPPDRAGR